MFDSRDIWWWQAVDGADPKAATEQKRVTYEFLKKIALKFEELGNFPLIYKNKVSRDFLFAVNWDKDKDPVIKSP